MTQSEPVSVPDPERNGANLVQELKKNNELLADVLDRVKKTEGRLKILESHLKERSNTSSSPATLRSREVPDEVRVSTVSYLCQIP